MHAAVCNDVCTIAEIVKKVEGAVVIAQIKDSKYLLVVHYMHYLAGMHNCVCPL